MDGKQKKGISARLKNIIAGIVFAVLALLVIYKVYDVLRWKDTTGDYLSAVDQLSATEKDLMDVVFVGSSHCYCGIYPSFFWEDMGISAFDMATSGQDKDSAYYHLKNLLKTQSPKLVFVDLYALTYDEHAVEGNIYRNLLSMPFSENSVKLVMDYADKEKWADYIARFPIIHTRYRELTKYDFISFSPNAYGRGEAASWRVEPVAEPVYADNDNNPADLSEKNMLWLNRLYDLSKEEGFELVFTVLPFTTNEEDQYLLDAASLFADEHGIGFIDFNRIRREVGYDYASDFMDTAHLNAKGARKTADYLEKYIAENYDLPDHRGDSKYHEWDEDLKWFKLLETENLLSGTVDLSSYIDILKSSDDFVAIISLEGTYIDDNHQFYEALSKTGMQKDEYGAGGKWIYEKGTLTKVFNNDTAAEPYIRTLGKNDSLRIMYQGDYIYPENVMIGKETYYNKGGYLCITVYDTFLEKVIESKVFW